MLRRLIFAVCAVALTLAACGRQVTPDRIGQTASGLQSGYMQIKFTTAGPLDFNNVLYVIALNTSGTGGEPWAPYGNQLQNWRDFSFEIVVGATNGNVQAQLWEFVTQRSVGGGTYKQPYGPLSQTPQNLIVNPNCNGAQTQFCVTVNRSIFNGILAGPASASPSAAPSASPTASPTAAGSPPAGASAPTAVAGTWYVNWFTASPTSTPYGQVLDAPGIGGAQDSTFVFKVDVTQTFDQQFTSQAGWPAPASPSEQIAGGEILNNP